jgi:hypothetical protein
MTDEEGLGVKRMTPEGKWRITRVKENRVEHGHGVITIRGRRRRDCSLRLTLISDNDGISGAPQPTWREHTHPTGLRHKIPDVDPMIGGTIDGARPARPRHRRRAGPGMHARLSCSLPRAPGA